MLDLFRFFSLDFAFVDGGKKDVIEARRLPFYGEKDLRTDVLACDVHVPLWSGPRTRTPKRLLELLASMFRLCSS